VTGVTFCGSKGKETSVDEHGRVPEDDFARDGVDRKNKAYMVIPGLY
jgi:hypothetical protein